MLTNRFCGIVVTLLGCIYLFWIIPTQTESETDSVWLSPSTIPTICVVVIILMSILLTIFPKGKTEFNGSVSMRALLFFSYTVIALILMKFAGFVLTAPCFMIGLMLWVGERRKIWLLSGSVVVPAVIWFCIEYLLKRPLP